MSITSEEVERIAKLAKLEFDPAESEKLKSELSQILGYVDQLSEVHDTASAAPEEEGVNLMRDDVASPLTAPSDLLNQAPDRDGNFLKVKSILE